MKPLRCLSSRFFLLASAFILLTTSCAPAPTINTTDPRPGANFVLVTPNNRATDTPFRPSRFTPDPTFTALPAATLAPKPTLLPTDTALPPTSIPTDTTPPTALPTDTSAPPPVVSADKPQYAIAAQMDYAGHTVTVSENVSYPNTSDEALSSILLGVNTNLWNGVFNLKSLSINDQAWRNYTLSGQRLTVNLSAPLQPGQTVKIGIGYRLALPYSAGKFENFGYTGHAANLIDWYPFVVPYINGAWVLPEPYPFGENLVYPEADFRVSLSFADPAHQPVVAASSPATLDNGTLTYLLPNARNFTISASPDFLVSSADANGVAVYDYYYAEDATAAAQTLEMTRLALNTYSASFGPYVHGALSVVETDLNDGLETDGLYFLGRSFYRSYPLPGAGNGSVQNDLSVIAVHETAHQWWYGAVANNQAEEPWLDEALATYSEHVFFENNYPSLVNWWWNFRVNAYSPTGYVDTRIYNTSAFRPYVNAVYLDGANFLDALRLRIGDAAFLAFLRDYYARERGSISSAGAFFAILSQHTSVDYSDLVKAYFQYR